MSVEAHSAMRLGLQLTIRQTNVPQGGYPFTVNVSPMQAESFHGSHARVKTFLEVLAAFLQTPESFSRDLRDSRKHLGKCGGTCATCANVSANAAELAQPAQTSRKIPRNLRSLRKRLGKCGGTCAACANVSVNAAELARPAQTPKSFLRDLQQCCKRQKVFRGTCNGVASVSKNTLTVIARYPRHSPEIRNLILLSSTRSVRIPDFKGDQRP